MFLRISSGPVFPVAVLVSFFVLVAGCNLNAEDSLLRDKKGTFALLNTDKGMLPVELYPESAPETVSNFITLANKGFYDGIVFHRVIENFMAQTGDPQGNGTGGPGYVISDEINAKALGLDKILLRDASHYHDRAQNYVIQKMGVRSQEELDRRHEEANQKLNALINGSVMDFLKKLGYTFKEGLPSRKAVRGSVAMANAGPNSNGSQFFINQTDTPHLDGFHTVFGQLISNYDVLDKIIEAGNGNSKIISIKIVKK